jgi:hypothetical protein
MVQATNDVPTHRRTTPRETADIQYRIASTRQEREAAFRLVYHSYLQAGLGERNRHNMRVTPYHLLESTEMFIAERQGNILFTMSLIMDSKDLGMPLEKVYADEVEQLRQTGRELGEVSCLAGCSNFRKMREFFPVFVGTCRLMVQYARHCGLHAILAAVHPTHARFYRRFMDFRVLGGERAYPTVRNNPAVALWLEFDRIDQELPASYEIFFGSQIPRRDLQPQPLSWLDCEYFKPMIDPNFKCAPLGDSDEYEEAAAETSPQLAFAV